MYINEPVYQHKQLIDELTQDKNKIDYGGSLYRYMDWHRIVDENIVRAVETSIYSKIYNDPDHAYEKI